MKKALLATTVVALSALGLTPLGLRPAAADPIGSGSARGFGISVDITDQGAVPPSAEATAVAPPFAEDTVSVLVSIPVDPVIVSGTAIGEARVHPGSDIETVLESEGVEQSVPGPYNEQGIGQVEALDVLLGVPGEGVSVLSADVLRAEAVAVCTAGVVQYSGNSEVVNLQLAGTELPINGPLTDLIGAIGDALAPLAPVVTIETNVVNELEGGGVSVDALVITLLAAIGETPLATIVVGHAEVGPAVCAPPPGQVTKDGPNTVVAGEPFDYTITATNTGTICDLLAVKVTDVVTGPAGSSVTATSPTADSVSGSADAGGITVVWNDIGPIAVGESKTLTLTVKTPADAAQGAVYHDVVSMDYTCAGSPFLDTDQIDRPTVQRPMARTGVEMTSGLLAGGALVLGALAFGLVRRRATAI